MFSARKEVRLDKKNPEEIDFVVGWVFNFLLDIITVALAPPYLLSPTSPLFIIFISYLFLSPPFTTPLHSNSSCIYPLSCIIIFLLSFLLFTRFFLQLEKPSIQRIGQFFVSTIFCRIYRVIK